MMNNLLMRSVPRRLLAGLALLILANPGRTAPPMLRGGMARMPVPNNFFSPPAASFFSMTSSNFWGESPNSAPVFAPSPAQTPNGVALIYIGP